MTFCESLALFGTEDRQWAKAAMLLDNLIGNAVVVLIGTMLLITDSERLWPSAVALLCIGCFFLVSTFAKAYGVWQAGEEIIMKFGTLPIYVLQWVGRAAFVCVVVGARLLRLANANSDVAGDAMFSNRTLAIALTAVGSITYIAFCCCAASLMSSAKKTVPPAEQ